MVVAVAVTEVEAVAVVAVVDVDVAEVPVAMVMSPAFSALAVVLLPVVISMLPLRTVGIGHSRTICCSIRCEVDSMCNDDWALI